jgi:arginase family enzyme
MSDIAPFFSPLDVNEITNGFQLSDNQFGKTFSIFTDNDSFPSLEGKDIAIVGVCEDRNSENNTGSNLAPNDVRGFLYKLFSGNFRANVVDLGNINPGNTTQDTYFAVKSTVDFLVRKNIIPVIIGGSQDISYAQFLGYKDLEQTINIVAIDSVFDLGNTDEDISNTTYLGKIILHQPNYLFNYSNIGYQTYLVDTNSLQMMNQLFFDSYRLGQVRDKIEESEPIIRQADMISFDITAKWILCRRSLSNDALRRYE